MPSYHDRTLALLGLHPTTDDSTAATLERWASQNQVTLPAAYVEWAALGGQRLLEKYSNQDSFPFDRPQIITTPGRERGLLFQEENQGNFQLIALLDRGDDPPVLYAWCGDPPWVLWCGRFSDAVFAQIFDWQYMLEFDPEYPDEGEITFYGSIRLRSSGCLQYLREHFQETVSTDYLVEGEQSVNYRFWRSPQERITVDAPAQRAPHLTITGPYEAAVALEAELLEAFADEVIPQDFGAVLSAMDFLERAIREGWWTQLRYACLQRPQPDAIDRLVACNQSCALSKRARNDSFPWERGAFTLGGSAWGVTIRFRSIEAEDHRGGWFIESID